MDEELTFKQIVTSMSAARADGLEPEKLVIGVKEKEELLKESDVRDSGSTVKNSTTMNTSMQVAGLDVDVIDIDQLRLLTVNSEEGEDGFYII
jgi:hypothetical protein